MTNHLPTNCAYCDEVLELDQKTPRHQNKWFHASCFKSIPNKDAQKPSTLAVKSTLHLFLDEFDLVIQLVQGFLAYRISLLLQRDNKAVGFCTFCVMPGVGSG